jgi:hypothetical protein
MIGGSLLRGGSCRGEKRCLIDDFAIFLQQPLTQPLEIPIVVKSQKPRSKSRIH